MTDYIALDRKNIWHPFTSLHDMAESPLIVRGEGVYLYTSDGRKILDAISSWWVNLHGHSNAHIAKAIAAQALELEHVIFAGFTHKPAITLSENLLKILPGNQSRLFFSDNGSTAVEVGLKMAFQYWHNQGIKKSKIVAIKGAYHGDTFGAMSVAERGLFTRAFHPYLFETTFIDFPDAVHAEQALAQFRAAIDTRDVAAFIFEPLVQAAAGMRMYESTVLDACMEYAQSQGVICIADEVFTGFGRTGKYFASEYLKQKPEIMALSKGITGGFLPLGVTSCSDKIVSAFDSPELTKTFFHGHSYTANPLACAAANASFDLLTDDSCQARITEIARQHHMFAESLRHHKHIARASNLGTIVALTLKNAEDSTYENSLRKKIYPYFLEKNILLRPLGNVIYVLPPYVISDAELATLYKEIETFLETM